LKEPRAEALRWLLQAENDLGYAELGFREGYYAQVCFQCQQICEKALKSIHFGKLEKRTVLGHSLIELTKELNIEPDLRLELGILDQYYIPTRYPNGLPGALPYETYTREQTERAIAACRKTITLARGQLPPDTAG
jgi:HEPN domain-containing protein